MKAEKRVENSMTSAPRFATKSMSVKQAWQVLKEGDFRHLPVIEAGKVVGVVSDRDLRQAVAVSDRVELAVSEVMTQEPYSASIGTPLIEVVQEMIEHKYGCAVVLDSMGHVAGIFTRTDAMRILADLLQKEPQSAVRKLGFEKYLFPNYLV